MNNLHNNERDRTGGVVWCKWGSYREAILANAQDQTREPKTPQTRQATYEPFLSI